MKPPSLLSHLRDVLILPFTVTVIVPYLLFDNKQQLIPNYPGLKIIGFLITICGITLLFYTINQFRTIGNGTLAPWTPTQKLIISGPYKYCRNPMISGVFFILIGETMIFHSTNILIWTGAFFIINTLYFILVEEPSLSKRFGSDYREYKSHVPRWIPKFKPYDKNE